MDNHLDWLGEVDTENTHNRLGVDRISAGNEIDVLLEHGGRIDKVLDHIDCVELNHVLLHL